LTKIAICRKFGISLVIPYNIDKIYPKKEDYMTSHPSPTHIPDSGSIVRSYLTMVGLYTLSASLIWGVNTLFLLDAGLELVEVFIANAVFTGSMALFEIPTGVLADTRGRRASFLLSLAVILVGTLGYVGVAAIQGGLAWFVLMSVILGLGYTFYSGAMEAWLVDALAASGFEGKLDRVFARSSMVSGAAMLIGSIGGGFLGEINLSLPFLARSGLLGMVFVFAFYAMHDIGFEPVKTDWRSLPQEMRKVALASIHHGWKHNEVRLLILAGLAQAVVLAWGFYAWQPYFLDLLGREITWVAGVIAALISLSTIFGNSIVEWFTKICGRRTTLLLWASGISSVALVGVGLSNSFWVAVPLYLVSMGAYGVITPVKQAYLHQIIPSDQRATVISFDSLVASGGSMLGQSGLGYLSQAASLSTSYISGGAWSLVAIPILLGLRRLSEPADFITDEAGIEGVCAAQGLPDIATVDNKARQEIS
jgi:MFS family permease